METRKYEIEIEGITPLLMNRFRDAQLETKIRRADVKQQEIEDKLYLLDNGDPYIPSTYLRNAMIEAGKQIQIAGKKRSTYSKVIGATLDIQPDCIEIMPPDYVPFRISAVNPATRGRMIVIRPQFNKWSLKFVIIAPTDIPKEKLNEIIVEAGQNVGIGDWRPQKKGRYGKFLIKGFK